MIRRFGLADQTNNIMTTPDADPNPDLILILTRLRLRSTFNA